MSYDPVVVIISGPSASGKTKVSKEFKKTIIKTYGLSVVHLQQDWYYKSANENANFDCMDALDFDQTVADIKGLKKWKTIMAPMYDFATHTNKGRINELHPAQIIIVEGILSLCHEELRKLADIKIYVDAQPEVCLQRRLKRDQEKRGRTIESILEQYNKYVIPCNEKLIYPCKDIGGIIKIENNSDDKIINLSPLNVAFKEKINPIKQSGQVIAEN